MPPKDIKRIRSAVQEIRLRVKHQEPFAPQITKAEHLLEAAKVAAIFFKAVAFCLGDDEWERQHKGPSRNLKDRKLWELMDQKKFGGQVWFRGEPLWRDSYRLQPAAYRPKHYIRDTKDGQRAPEKAMLHEFRLQALTRHGNCPAYGDEARWMCLARHWGLPTRLIDWSESILTAAWFACHDDAKTKSERQLAQAFALMKEHDRTGELGRAARKDFEEYDAGEPDCLIWALAPALLNWHFTRDGPIWSLEEEHAGVLVHAAFQGSSVWDALKEPRYETDGHRLIKALTPWDKLLKPLSDKCPEQEHLDNLVLAVKASQVDSRMMTQQAAFTIHGCDEDLATQSREPRSRKPWYPFLIKFSVCPKSRSEIAKHLRKAGIRQATVYPDLGNLAEDIAGVWEETVREIPKGK